jgi:quercetin dioxygenase-like cupin family protein
MTWKTIAAAAAALAAGCSAGPAGNRAANQAGGEAAANASASASASAPENPIQRRYDETMSGQPLAVPPAGFQLVVTRAQYPHNHRIPCHKHPWPRYVYIQQGNLRVFNRVTRREYDFGPGDTAVESIDQWHEGLVTSTVPLILVAVEQVPRGDENRVLCEAARE